MIRQVRRGRISFGYSLAVGVFSMPLEGPIHSGMRDKVYFTLAAVIAGLDPAIHAVPSLQIEMVLRVKVTAWMSWSSHGMTEGRRVLSASG